MQILEKKDPLATLKSSLSLMAQTAMADKLKQKQETRSADFEKEKSVRDIIARGYTRGSIRPKQGKTMQDIIMGSKPNLNDVVQVDASGNVIDTSMPAETTTPSANATASSGNPLISMLMNKMGLGRMAQVGAGLGRATSGSEATDDVQGMIKRYYATDDPDELADLEEKLQAAGVTLQ